MTQQHKYGYYEAIADEERGCVKWLVTSADGHYVGVKRRKFDSYEDALNRDMVERFVPAKTVKRYCVELRKAVAKGMLVEHGDLVRADNIVSAMSKIEMEDEPAAAAPESDPSQDEEPGAAPPKWASKKRKSGRKAQSPDKPVETKE